MKLPKLIIQTVRRVFDEDPEVLGVRLSPISLSAEEGTSLAEGRLALGDSVYLVVSAPGIPCTQGTRVYTAPDQRAAEQATAWRNSINLSGGEHLVYVSAEEHDKAGGLQDCLLEVTEDDLARDIVELCAAEGGVLRELAEALERAKLVEQVNPTELAAFVGAARKAVKNERGREVWRVIGANLPILGLARDTAMTAADAAVRLEQNQEVVSRASVAEGRRGSDGDSGEFIERIRSGIRDGRRERALVSTDLAELKVKKKPAKDKPGGGKAGRDGRKPKREKKAREKPENDVADIVDRRSQSEGVAPPDASGPSPRERARWPSVGALPEGLSSLLQELTLSGGSQVECRVRGSGRRACVELPRNTDLKRVPLDEAILCSAREVVRAARAQFLAAIDEDECRAVVLLSRVPTTLLRESRVRSLAAVYIESCGRLYGEAERSDDVVGRAVMELETIRLVDVKGEALLILGPLHPLWLSQALEIAGVEHTRGVEQQLIELVSESPSAPAMWPTATGELRLSAPIERLVVYEREPGAATAASLAPLGLRLIRRYLRTCPHARFGVRVAVCGVEPDGLIEGLAGGAREVARDEGGDVRVVVLCQQPVTLGPNGIALTSTGNLRIEAMPTEMSDLWKTRPHLVVRLSPPDPGPDDDEPGVAAGSPPAQGLLQTQFECAPSGLRARTSVVGVGALGAFDALHAALRRRRAMGAFTHDLRVSSLAAVIPTEGAGQAVWHVAVGPRLGRRPPAEFRTLICESIDGGATCVAIARDVRSAARAVSDGLVKLGLIDGAPARGSAALASRLAGATGGGILSLERSGEQLIASGLLALEMQRRMGGRLIVARVEGSHYRALVGESSEKRPLDALVLGASATKEGCLALTVGYASLDKDVDLHVQRGRLGGQPIECIRRVFDIVHLAEKRAGAGAIAAREVLSWLLWPAVAGEAERVEVVEALHLWDAGTPAAVNALVLGPASVAAVQQAKPVKVEGMVVDLAAISPALFNQLINAT